ncbi:MAG: VWA domain-containing protein [Planctomycetes bacterium]|nr:VWA domain-containing protein [Planctomycetota bacterium]
MGVSFHQPVWLWLLLLAPILAAVALAGFVAMSLARRWSAVVLRCTLIALMTAMLAGASAVRQSDQLAVVAVVDVSGSVRRLAPRLLDEEGRTITPIERAVQFLRAATATRGPDDLLGLVVFDGRSMAVGAPTRGDVLARPVDVTMREGTDIEAALRLAWAIIPPDTAGRVVLITDGVDTAGDALWLDAAATAARWPIDVAPVEYAVNREVMIDSVDAPPTAADGASVTVRVALRSTGPATGVLRLYHEDEPIDADRANPGFGRRVVLTGGERIELIDVPLPPGRLHRFKAVFEPDTAPGPNGSRVAIADTNPENNVGRAFTITPGRGAVLVLDGVGGGDPSGPGATLADTLRRAGLEVELRGPAGLPDSPLALQAFDLVILQNVPVEAVGERAQRALVAHVRDAGGGLVMVGGPDSFGAGGWRSSVLEPILPVGLELPESVVVPEVAIVLVLDSSGSMGQSVLGSSRTKQRVANDAAALAVRTMDKKDLVGVIEFDTSHHVIVPLGENTNPKTTAARIRAISPGGGTQIGPALREAGRQLGRVNAKAKHIIVLSDGQSMDAGSLPGMAQSLAARGIAVSTIAVGSEADRDTMRSIADRGGGTYYEVLNPNVLPRIFLKAVRLVRQPMISEQPFVPVVLPTGSPITSGLGDLPPLGGLVLTSVRDEPGITNALLRPQGEPVLAHWNVGLGQVAAFTSDASTWADAWIDTPTYARFWTALARTISRAAEPSSLTMTAEIIGDELHATIEAVSDTGRTIDLLSIPATLHTPGGRAVPLRFVQTAPGRYEATVPARQSGSYVIIAKPRRGGKDLPPIVGGTSVAGGVEFRSLRSNRRLLERLARRTGGRVLDLDNPAGADLFDRSKLRPAMSRLPIWRTLLVWTLLVFLLDVGTRRVAWDRLIGTQFGTGLRAAAAQALADRGAQAAGALSSLKRSGRKDERTGVDLGATALSEQDAEALAREQERRRRDEYLERLRQRRRLPADIPDAPDEEPARDDRPPDADDQPSGLLAAKRRARKRFDPDEHD